MPSGQEGEALTQRNPADCAHEPVCDESQRIADLEQQVERLREALQELVDWQNGPPLLSQKWRAGWGRAMAMAASALRASDSQEK